jgi:hypothetical protein
MTCQTTNHSPSDWNDRAALQEIAQDLQSLQDHLAAIKDQIADLEQAGVTEASPYWRKDKEGNPRILYLIHPSQNGQRKREYVGVDPAKQADALARVQRWEQRQRLLEQANRLAARLDRIRHDVSAIQIAVTEELAHCQTVQEKNQ